LRRSALKELSKKRLVIVSNRGPYSIRRKESGYRMDRLISGLVTAVEPAILKTGGVWISWGNEDRRMTVSTSHGRYVVRQIALPSREVSRYYYGFSNRALWPLCHNFLGRTHFNTKQWNSYQRTNQRFADIVLEETSPGDFVWVQDYHLALVPQLVRIQLSHSMIGHFWHTPFPSCEVFSALPWRREVLEGLLGCDLIGFHLKVDVENFLNCCKKILGLRVNRRKGIVFQEDRETRAQPFPISIDFDFFDLKARKSTSIEKALRLQRDLGHRKIVIGVDRLDYTKGICERLRAIRRLLERHPNLRGTFTFIQIAVPSRTRVPEYVEEKREIDELVGHINGEFSDGMWIPVRYIYGSLSQEELVSYYLASDIALLTPLKDGMNLVAKEYVASHVDEVGVLMLSEFTGAAEELKGALIVNPYDIEGVAETLRYALSMPLREKRRRMRALRRKIQRNDVFYWLQRFLEAAQPRVISKKKVKRR
jgi:trehalose 6-phosphate synthase